MIKYSKLDNDIFIGKLRDEALKRWILSLDDATRLSVNLTQFSDVELAGLRYMLSTWDITRLQAFKEQLKKRATEKPKGGS